MSAWTEESGFATARAMGKIEIRCVVRRCLRSSEKIDLGMLRRHAHARLCDSRNVQSRGRKGAAGDIPNSDQGKPPPLAVRPDEALPLRSV